MNKKLFFILLNFLTAHCFCADGSKQRLVDEQIIQAGSSILGLFVRLFSSEATVEHAQAQRRQSEDKPELPSDSGLIQIRTPEERRRFIQAQQIKGWVNDKKEK